jgi:hypothetical protein
VELLLGAEERLPGARVHAVGPDHHVEGALPAAPERDVHAVLVLVEDVDGVVEQELDVVADRRVQRGGQVPAPHLEVLSLDAPGDRVRVQGGHLGAVGVKKGEPAGVDVRVAELRQDPHAPHHVDGGAADVDRVAAPAWGVRLLDDRDLETVPVEPVRQRGAGEAGAGDEDRASCGVGLRCHDWTSFFR